MSFTAPKVQLLANAGPRVEHLDGKGGGTITRVMYVEPYLSYPWVELFLKGTVVNTGGGIWARVKPHADPIKPWFYCSDVQVHPFAPETVTGQAATAYAPSADFSYNAGGTGGQQTSINNVLGAVDDHGYTNIVDLGLQQPLTAAQITAGGIPYNPANAASISGKCGAFVVATYTPLIFLDGTLPSANQDPFDYVNPQWTPIEISTQVGRNLFFYSPTSAVAGPGTVITLQSGILDTFSRPEIIWEFSITRKMVPFLPSLTIGVLNNKLNSISTSLGNIGIPLNTARFISPEPPPLLRAPDGATYYDITYKYKIRKTFDEYFDDTVPAFKKGWIDWNHHFGVPASRTWPNIGTANPSYYPVCWNGGLFQLFGVNHPLYLRDQDMSGLVPPPVPSVGSYQLLSTEFTVGFQAGQ